MLPQLIIGAVVALASAVQDTGNKPYGNHNLDQALSTKKLPDGKTVYSVNKQVIGPVLDDLTAHAGDYPPRFRSKEDRARAERDTQTLIGVFDKAAASDDADSVTLYAAAYLNSIGHNLDIDGAPKTAANYYERLLKREPNHPRGNLSYGIFLASASKPKEGIPYLEKALKAGVEDARYSLGLAYLALGDKAKALEYLNAYLKRRPDSPHVKQLIEDIRSGRVRTKTEGAAK